jgi:hypothetical protein
LRRRHRLSETPFPVCGLPQCELWRADTKGSYFMVFNAILNFDNLPAGRKLAEK